MDTYSKQRSLPFRYFAILTVCLLFAYFIWSSTFTSPFISLQQYPSSLQNISNSTSLSASRDDLDIALSKASMGDNKTVIITVINRAYAEADIKSDISMLDLFINSFWLGVDTRQLIKHLLVVAVDRTAYERCEFLRLNCYRLEMEGVDFEGEKLYMSEEFNKMMWRRTEFLIDVLKRGYSFVFTDSDVMWLRNPFERLSKNMTEDLQISTDKYLGDPRVEKHLINTGFYYARSNNRIISLFETWYGKKDNSTGLKEQDILKDLIWFHGIIGKLNLSVIFLDTKYFSGFCEDSKDFKAVTTVHSNCCRSIAAKVRDLNVVQRDWKRFKKLTSYKRLAPLNLTENVRWSGHFGCWTSWNVSGTHKKKG